MNFFVLLESIENWGTSTGGIAAVIALVTGALSTIAGIITKFINDYRRSHHECPKHCITKKPLKPKGNGKPKA